MIVKEKQHFYLKIQLSTLYLIFISIAFIFTLFYYNSLKNSEYNYFTLNKLFSYVEENYKGEISKDEIYQNAMKGVINYLDSYSFAIVKEPEAELDTQTQELKLEDTFIGVGILSRAHSEGIVITDIFKQSDLYNKVNVGDVITSIDGNEYKGDYRKFRELLQGNKGDSKILEVYSQKDNDYIDVYIEIKSIYKEIIEVSILENNILYIEIKEFTEGLNDKLMLELEDLLLSYEEKVDLQGVIMNLAENRGGFFQEGLTLAANFIGNNTEVALYSEYNDSELSTEYFLDGNNIFGDIPMALIVNKNSASSSEIFAGIFQNFERGTIIGQNTFGKGVGQRLTKFNKDFQFAMTTFEFFIGKDKNKINEVGVSPNILIKEDYSKNKDKYIKAAINSILKDSNI